MLGTFVEIGIQDARPEAALHLLAEDAFQEIARVQGLMSFHDPESELSRLNEGAHLRPLRVHAWTHEVIAEAIRLGDASNGIFDIAVAPRLIQWRLLPKKSESSGHGGTYRDIELTADEHIRFRRPLTLDLGGIAKGFAVDKAIEALARAGVAQATVNAGGDLRFIGPIPEVIMIRDPQSPHGRLIPTPVFGPAAATSAPYFTHQRRFFRTINHLVDPFTRKPAAQNSSVTAFSHSCMHADALTKIVLLSSPAVWQKLLHQENAHCVIYSASGAVSAHLTSVAPSRLKSHHS